jgi:hypothetical protein
MSALKCQKCNSSSEEGLTNPNRLTSSNGLASSNGLTSSKGLTGYNKISGCLLPVDPLNLKSDWTCVTHSKTM